jgi:hypothetical protein
MKVLDNVDELSGQEQYVDASVTTLRSLTILSRGDAERARELLGAASYEGALPAMRAEYLAARALVLACSGEPKQAMENAQLAHELSTAIEPRVLSTFARSIVALDKGDKKALEIARIETFGRGNLGSHCLQLLIL